MLGVPGAAVLLLLLAPAGATAAWRWPVEGEVVREFVVKADRFAPGQHRGINVAAPVGTPVRAACGGRVRFAGPVADNGRTVSVVCGRHVATYLHLQSIAVRRGQPVPPGTRVGTVGRTGRPGRGPTHLHLGARELSSGRYVDPRTLLGATTSPPPVVAGPRTAPRLRPTPLGPAPRAAPAPRTAPAPRDARLTVPGLAGPVASPTAPPTASSRPARALPLAVWAGLALLAAGLPVGALVRVRGRRQERAVAWRMSLR
jgi:murein DD-endopeptidase MepM/ murein hydrolase activator NlpD